MNSSAIEVLLTERSKLITERDLMTDKFYKAIADLEASIERLSGKKVWEIVSETKYDDETPDYVKASQEEM